jgi:hypothetical protein
MDPLAEKDVIWTPDGLRTIGAKAPERVELRAEVMEWLRQFADVAEALKLGVHCGLCGADLVGRNSDSDRVFSATCGCREFIGRNREWTPSPQSRLH